MVGLKPKEIPKAFSFVELTDGSSLKGVQIIVDNTLENYESEIKNLGLGSAIQVKGEIKESQGKGQRIEILAQSVLVHGTSPTDYPLQKKGQSPEFYVPNPTFEREPILLARLREFEERSTKLFITSLKEMGFITFIPPSSQQVIVRVLEKCSKLRHWTSTILQRLANNKIL